MTLRLSFFLGLNGLPPGESERLYALERRVAPIMVLVALLAAPSFYFEDLQQGHGLRSLGLGMDAAIFASFLVETLLMLALCRQKLRYLGYNWLNLLIIVASGLALVGLDSSWIPLVRLLRLTYVSLAFARLLGHLRRMVTSTIIPYALALGLGAVLLAGLGFYWLEPTVHSYEDGLWLAFTTAATIGYGDIVPTRGAARLLAAVVVLVGYAVFSLITASIAAFFIGEGERRLQREIYRDMKLLRQELAQIRAEMQRVDADVRDTRER